MQPFRGRGAVSVAAGRSGRVYLHGDAGHHDACSKSGGLLSQLFVATTAPNNVYHAKNDAKGFGR